MHECLGWPGPVTDRQHRAWMVWLDERMNNPGSLESYVMQVAAEVRRGNAKKPNQVKLEHMRLKFVRAKKPAPLTAKSREQVIAATKSVWVGRMLGSVKQG